MYSNKDVKKKKKRGQVKGTSGWERRVESPGRTVRASCVIGAGVRGEGRVRQFRGAAGTVLPQDGLS